MRRHPGLERILEVLASFSVTGAIIYLSLVVVGWYCTSLGLITVTVVCPLTILNINLKPSCMLLNPNDCFNFYCRPL